MKNWTIGKRIATGFAVIIIITLALGVFACLRLVFIKEQASQTLPAIQLIARAQRNAVDYDKIVYKHIGSGDLADMTRLEAGLSADTADNTQIYAELDKIITNEKGRALLDKTTAARANYVTIRTQVIALSRQMTNNVAAYALARSQMDPASDQYLAALDDLVNFIKVEAENRSKGIQSAVQTSQLGIIIGLALATLVGISVAVVHVRGTTKILNGVAAKLNDGSKQVAAAASQVSASSQLLARGSGEQATSIEETGSSLEKMADMTRRNSENAQKANDLAKQARTAADRGAADMQTMNASMQAIKASSDDIAKIIRTIDEIAFQTNILALNAAVEAARAGEAGMGFAVVADEVRNLAQRSAQAAKETAAKIEGAISKTAQGVEISGKVGMALNEIVTKARQLDELASEVAASSREQTDGIAEINAAVGQMDKVTQSNAAGAEQSAAAAQELNAQAEQMKHFVNELLLLVGRGQASVGFGTEPMNIADTINLVATAPAKLGSNHRLNSNGHHSAAARPELAAQRNKIPLDGDFKDF